MTVYVILAVLGAALVAAGAALWSLPFGLAVSGAEALAGAYVGAYAHVRRQTLEIERR